MKVKRFRTKSPEQKLAKLLCLIHFWVNSFFSFSSLARANESAGFTFTKSFAISTGSKLLICPVLISSLMDIFFLPGPVPLHDIATLTCATTPSPNAMRTMVARNSAMNSRTVWDFHEFLMARGKAEWVSEVSVCCEINELLFLSDERD